MRHRSDCRKGIHSFGGKSDAGGGIGRRVCTGCGLVQIDLESEAEVEGSKLFGPTRVDSMFAVQTALETAFDLREQRFGVRPDRRRVSTEAP